MSGPADQARSTVTVMPMRDFTKLRRTTPFVGAVMTAATLMVTSRGMADSLARRATAATPLGSTSARRAIGQGGQGNWRQPDTVSLYDHGAPQTPADHSAVTDLAKFLGVWFRPALCTLIWLRQVSLTASPETCSAVPALGLAMVAQNKVANRR